MRLVTVAREVAILAISLDAAEEDLVRCGAPDDAMLRRQMLRRHDAAMAGLEDLVARLRTLLHASNDAEVQLSTQRLGPQLTLLPEGPLDRVIQEGAGVRKASRALRCVFDARNTALDFDGYDKRDGGYDKRDGGGGRDTTMSLIMRSPNIQRLSTPVGFGHATLALKCASANLQGLTTLHVGIDVSLMDDGAFPQALERLTMLQSLSLQLDVGIGAGAGAAIERTLRALAPAVGAMSRLRCFTLGSSGRTVIPQEASEALTALLRGLPRELETLALLRVRVDAAHLGDALLRTSTLQSLQLHVHRTIDLAGMPAVFEQLARLRSVQVVVLGHYCEDEDEDEDLPPHLVEPPHRWSPAKLLRALVRPAPDEHQLTRIELSGSPLTDDMADLPDALRSCPGLAEVSLRHLRMGPDAIEALAPALFTLTGLTDLDLDGNGIGPRGMFALCYTPMQLDDLEGPIPPLRRPFPRLRRLSLSMNGLGGTTAMLDRLELLQHLTICFNGLGDRGMLATSLWDLDRLETLDIRCNGMTAAGLMAFVGQMGVYNKRLSRVRASCPRDLTGAGETSLKDVLPCLELPSLYRSDLDVYMRDLCDQWGAVNVEDMFHDAV